MQNPHFTSLDEDERTTSLVTFLGIFFLYIIGTSSNRASLISLVEIAFVNLIKILKCFYIFPLFAIIPFE